MNVWVYYFKWTETTSNLSTLLIQVFLSIRPHWRKPTRLPCPWDSPGKNTGVGCHFLFQCMKVKSESEVASVVSDSVRPQRRRPTKIPRPWDSPGKNTGVGCHFLLQYMKVKSESEVAQQCPTLATPRTAAYQAPPSMGFSRQKYWSGVPLPSPSSARYALNNN